MTRAIPLFLNESIERKYGFSRAVLCDRLLFVSGTVGIDASGAVVGKGEMARQVAQAYENLRTILECAGATAADVVKETIFTTDIGCFLNESHARHDFYACGLPPATTGVEVRRLALPELMVEIELVAYLGGSD